MGPEAIKREDVLGEEGVGELLIAETAYIHVHEGGGTG